MSEPDKNAEEIDEPMAEDTDTGEESASESTGSRSPTSGSMSESTDVPDSTSESTCCEPAADAQAATNQPPRNPPGTEAKRNPMLTKLLNKRDPDANKNSTGAPHPPEPAEGREPESPSKTAKRSASEERRPDPNPSSPTKKLKPPFNDPNLKK